jgi:hypothetical protein
MLFGMAHSLFLFAERVVTIMLFTGLAGCSSVVVVSWISIFKDGFSDLKNRDGEAHWEPSHFEQVPQKPRATSASFV